ncbi:MAG TPA: TIGR00289 family protein [Thermoplasmata archaeon]|nr:TIGR00289 family protein [Thermoplasmata archaeon]HIH97806.1 TIGR00289 family protein [Thermoplasmata archaeon]
MQAASLFTGGKDSTYSLYIVQQWGWEIKCLVTLLPQASDSWMFHYPNLHLISQIAEALDIPLIKRETEGKKERELIDLKRVLSSIDVGSVVSGATASEYQRVRLDQIAYQLNLKHFAPLWHKNQEKLLLEMIHAGFKISMVGCSAYGLDKSWLGREIDINCFKELKKISQRYGISMVGEGGEFESLVTDGPNFKKRLIIDEAAKEWKRDRGIYRVKRAHLEEKD